MYVIGQSKSLYDHYVVLILSDLLWLFLQAIVVWIVVMLVHTYYGYNVDGGSVDIAVGQVVWTSLIVVVVIVVVILFGGVRRVR